MNDPSLVPGWTQRKSPRGRGGELGVWLCSRGCMRDVLEAASFVNQRVMGVLWEWHA